MSVPLAAMDYLVGSSPPVARGALQHNPYVCAVAAGGPALLPLAGPGLLCAGAPSPDAVLTTGAGGHDVVHSVDSEGNTAKSHKPMEIPTLLRQRFPPNAEGLQMALDTYKIPLYGPNLTVVRERKRFSPEETVTYTPKLREIQTDQHGALSFSAGYSNQMMCVHMMDYFQRCKIGLKGLTITDASAACGGDSMQFLLTKTMQHGTERLFESVTSVEINKNRCSMLRNNMEVVKRAFPDSAQSTVICANYGAVIGVINQDNQGDVPYVTQDVVFIDPPWGGKSQDQSRSALTLYTVTKDPKLIKDFDGEELIIDYRLAIHHLVQGIITRNEDIVTKNDNDKQTSMVAVKTPMYWQNDMIDTIRHMNGYIGAETVRCGKYDVVLFFLKTLKTPKFVQQSFKTGQLKGFLSWQEQEKELKAMFPELEVQKFCTEEKPVFLQDIWNNMDESMGKELDEKWNNKYTHPYSAGALHHSANLHNGEKKLLHSSLYTILYGLKRAKKHPYFNRRPWSLLLNKVIVLYVGAAGLKKDSHHFNELLRAIPTVHFVCYDIRKVETALPAEYTDRMTVFHKIFTNNDLERWVSFAQKYTDKPIIFISDIRTDWTSAMQEMDASKTVALRKIWLLKCLQELPPPMQPKHDSKGRRADSVNMYAISRTERLAVLRREIDLLFRHNRAISLWVDRQVETDNFVQWRWFRRMQEATTSCAIMSSKTREPYQTVSNPTQSFYYFPGAVLFQTGTSASSEVRTQCCPDNFEPKDPKTYIPKGNMGWKRKDPVSYAEWSVRRCVDFHFRSKGDPSSFVTENIDYTREWHSSFDNEEDNVNKDLHRQSVKLHDSKLAWYNNDVTQTQHRKYSFEAVKIMYESFHEELAARSIPVRFDVLGWFKDKDKKMKPRELENDSTAQEQAEHAPDMVDKSGWPGLRKRNAVQLDELIRMDNDALVTAHIQGTTMPAWANLETLTIYFSPQATLRRYEWHLLASDKIWDISRAAMEALLVLNMHLKNSPTLTTKQINMYQWINSKTMMPDRLSKKLSETEQLTMRSRTMPRELLLGQLRFNLQNPYRGTMYDPESLHLTGRYEVITEFLNKQVLAAEAGRRVAPLLYKPGSACSSEAEVWVKSLIEPYGDRDISPGGTDLARDWYCYWLQTLLQNRDGSNLKDSITHEQIREAVMPFFVSQKENGGNLKLYRSPRYFQRGDDSVLRPPLDLTRWPRGKPVLYFACEQGCRAMIEFCLDGCSAKQRAEMLNTPRRRPMRVTAEMLAARKAEKEAQRLNPSETNADDEQGILVDADIENFPLHTAVWNGQYEIVQMLLNNGADPDLQNHWNENAIRCVEASMNEYTYSSAHMVRLQTCKNILENHYKRVLRAT